MKTYLTITYTTGRHESQWSTIRPRSAKKPTVRGAERMVADHLNRDSDGEPIRPSDICICRIEECCYQTR